MARACHQGAHDGALPLCCRAVYSIEMAHDSLAKAMRMLSGPEAEALHGFAERFLADTEVDLGILRSPQALSDATAVLGVRRHFPGGGFGEQELVLVPLCNLGVFNVGLVVSRARRVGSGSDWWSARDTKSTWSHLIGRYFRNEISGEILYVASDADGTSSASEPLVILSWFAPVLESSDLDREIIFLQLDPKSWARALGLARGEGGSARRGDSAMGAVCRIEAYERSVRTYARRNALVSPTGARDFRFCRANMESYCGGLKVRAQVSKNHREDGGTASAFSSTIKLLSGVSLESTRHILLTFAMCDRNARRKVCFGVKPKRGRRDSASTDANAVCLTDFKSQRAQNDLCKCPSDSRLHANWMDVRGKNICGKGADVRKMSIPHLTHARWSRFVDGDAEACDSFAQTFGHHCGQLNEDYEQQRTQPQGNATMRLPVGTVSIPQSSPFCCHRRGHEYRCDAVGNVDAAVREGPSLNPECEVVACDVPPESSVQDRRGAPISAKTAENPHAALAAQSSPDSEKLALQEQPTQAKRRKYSLEEAKERRKMSNRRSAARAKLRKRERFLSLERKVAESREAHAAAIAREAALRTQNEVLRSTLRLVAQFQTSVAPVSAPVVCKTVRFAIENTRDETQEGPPIHITRLNNG